MKRFCILVSAILLVSAAIWFVTTSRAAYESAPYEIREKAGNFEIREYPELVVVSTPMENGSRDGSFGRLFRYISGKNESGESIEMTTPVFMPAESDGDAREMQFVLPTAIAGEGAPRPSDASITLETMERGRYAVLRYSGRSGAKMRREMLERLRHRLEKRGLSPAGDPVFAGYDPPWTPAPVRRNEVLLRIGEDS